MSRQAAATTAGRAHAIPRTPVPALPRRVSGPAVPNRRDDGPPPGDRRRAPRPRAFPAPHPQRLAYGGVAIATRVAGIAVDVSASPLMDRLVRSRVWIGIVACSLIGLVAMQVSMLKLNSGIGRAVQTASTLERSNAGLRGEISRLSAGDRIQRLAEAEGLVMPAPSDVTYLRSAGARGDAVRAAQRMGAPDPATAGPAGASTDAAVPVTMTAPAVTGTAAPVAGGPAGAAPGAAGVAPVTTAATAPTGAAVAPTGAAPATSAPATATAPAAQPATTQATAPPAGAPSGGASPQPTATP
ncbi:MAG: hypothetical protein QOJ35_575 [Solirubrobacteraceae bacterium]|jgi:cell division protein FtsL|nr:hypothetical protein [Solirubrobacteraceae bacterium]